MNVFTSVAIVNVAIISLVGLGIYITHEWWPLLALFFMHTAGSKSKDSDIKGE